MARQEFECEYTRYGKEENNSIRLLNESIWRKIAIELLAVYSNCGSMWYVQVFSELEKNKHVPISRVTIDASQIPHSFPMLRNIHFLYYSDPKVFSYYYFGTNCTGKRNQPEYNEKKIMIFIESEAFYCHAIWNPVSFQLISILYKLNILRMSIEHHNAQKRNSHFSRWKNSSFLCMKRYYRILSIYCPYDSLTITVHGFKIQKWSRSLSKLYYSLFHPISK